MANSAFDACTPEPAHEGAAVVIAAERALREGRAAELGGPDDERVLGEAALAQILEEGGDGTIDARGHGREFGGDVAVVVPVVQRALGTAPDLDKAHPALDEARGEEAALREIGGGFVRTVETIGFAGGLRLAHDIEGLGCAELHLRGEFVAGDAGGEA